MENTREATHRGIQLQAGGNGHHEMETQQLLPLTSTAHSRTNTHRSHRASISNVSSVSSVEPGGERKYSYALSALLVLTHTQNHNGCLLRYAGTLSPPLPGFLSPAQPSRSHCIGTHITTTGFVLRIRQYQAGSSYPR